MQRNGESQGAYNMVVIISLWDSTCLGWAFTFSSRNASSAHLPHPLFHCAHSQTTPPSTACCSSPQKILEAPRSFAPGIPGPLFSFSPPVSLLQTYFSLFLGIGLPLFSDFTLLTPPASFTSCCCSHSSHFFCLWCPVGSHILSILPLLSFLQVTFWNHFHWLSTFWHYIKSL